MTDQLPSRPFTALPPPPSGATGAVRGGRSIRRRRRAAGAGAAALTVAVLTAVLAMSGAGFVHANDQLVPAGPGPGVDAPHSAPSTSRQPASPASGPVPGAAGPRAEQARSEHAQPAGSPQPTAAPYAASGHRPAAGRYRTPALRRTYAPPVPAGARVCTASISNSPGGTHKRIDWCMTASVNATDAGHDLSVEVCRDQTTDAALSFDTTLEADLVVSRAGRVVWRWSVGHTASTHGHALQTPAGACWSWTAPWTDVDGSGRALAPGSYDLVGTSLAGELADLPDASTAFKIG